MLLDILDEGHAHAYRMLTGTHQQIGIAVYIMYLEEELCLALVILQNGLQVAYHRIIYRIALHIDGKASMRFSLTVCRYSTLPIWKSR